MLSRHLPSLGLAPSLSSLALVALAVSSACTDTTAGQGGADNRGGEAGALGSDGGTSSGGRSNGGNTSTGGKNSDGTGGKNSAGGGGAATGGTDGSGGVASTGGASGGTDGSGGDPGSTGGTGGEASGGSGGTSSGGSNSGGSGGATGGSSGVSCATLPICDGFESGTSGTAPSGGAWTVRTQSGGSVVLDNAQKHSGSMSVRAQEGMAYLVNANVLPAPAGKIYVRSFMRWKEAVPSSHVNYIAISQAVNDESQEMRFGGMQGYLHFNAMPGDGLAPNPFASPCTTCVAPPVGQWVCVEVMFDYENEVATTWVGEGATQKEFTVDEPSDFHAASTWPSTAEELKIGFRAFGGTNTVWYDDVAVGYERIGCSVLP